MKLAARWAGLLAVAFFAGVGAATIAAPFFDRPRRG